MEVEVSLAPLVFTMIVSVVSECVLKENLFKVDQRSLFRAIFDEKGWISKYLPKILAKKYNQNSQPYLFVLISVQNNNIRANKSIINIKERQI